MLAADLDRLAVVRSRRAAAAQEYFAAVAERWDEERLAACPGRDRSKRDLLDAIGDDHFETVLDLGTGTGRMLQIVARHAAAHERPIRRAVGLDSSHSMLAVARSNLERAEIRHVDLRQGDVYSPPFERDSFDLIVIHQVLHFLDDPARAVREAAALLSPQGRLRDRRLRPPQRSSSCAPSTPTGGSASGPTRSPDGSISADSTSPPRARSTHPGSDRRTPDRLAVAGHRPPTRLRDQHRHRDSNHRRTTAGGSGMSVSISFEVFPPKHRRRSLGPGRYRRPSCRRVDPVFVSVTYGAGGSDRQRSFDAIGTVRGDGRRGGRPPHLCRPAPPRHRQHRRPLRRTRRTTRSWPCAAIRRAASTPCTQPHPDGFQTTAELVAEIKNRSDLQVAVSAYPERHPQSPTDDHDLRVLADKVAAGADRAMTQMFFDNELYFAVSRSPSGRRGIDIAIVPGIFPIHSFPAVARFAARCGASIPDHVAERFAGLDDDTETTHKIAAELAAEQIAELAADGVEQVHLYTLNRSDAGARRLRPARITNRTRGLTMTTNR